MREKAKAAAQVLGCCAAAALLIGYAPAAAAGAVHGIRACGEIILPAVFPFLALSVYMAGSSTGETAGQLLGGVAARCYRLPPQAAPALLMSWIGGYPAGAKVLAEYAARGVITAEDAAYGATVCINSGPAFLAGVVGARLFGSVWMGIFLFLCQLAAGLITARIMAKAFRRSSVRRLRRAAPKMPREKAAVLLVRSVTSAAGSAVNICAFVVLLSAFSEVLFSCGIFTALSKGIAAISCGTLGRETTDCLLTGLLEICAGCAAVAEIPPSEAAKILPFLLSFGGASVCCQVAACFGEQGLPWGKLVLSRLLHGGFTALLAHFWFPRWVQPAMTGAPVLAIGGGRLIWGCLWMLVLCGMLVARWERPVTGMEYITRRKRKERDTIASKDVIKYF